MFNLNEYNYKNQVKRFLLYLIILNFLEIVYILSKNVYSFDLKLFISLPLLFLIVWLYILLWYIKVKRVAHEEELRQIRLQLTKNDKREYSRYILPLDQHLRVTFSVLKTKFFIDFKKRKTGKVVDISEGGLRVHVDTTDLLEGDEAMDIKIVFLEGKSIKVRGIVVRAFADQSAIKFIKISEHDQRTIADFIMSCQVKGCNEP